jgi:hypothetical protein
MCRVKFIYLRIVLLLAGITLALVLPRIHRANAASSTIARKAVIVELFTSEGCSSCPPADELLGRLRQEKLADGLEVIPLGLHVDYWNFQGWTDRFSSADYTDRQNKYATRFATEGPYTPQMVVDGDQQFVGNDAARARQAILKAAGTPPPAAVEISGSAPDKLEVRVKAPENLTGDVLLAITEDNLSNKIHSGENEGRELHHSAVVRRFERLGELRHGVYSGTIRLHFDKDWKQDDLRIVVWVQEPGNGKITGAASIAAAPVVPRSAARGPYSQ